VVPLSSPVAVSRPKAALCLVPPLLISGTQPELKPARVVFPSWDLGTWPCGSWLLWSQKRKRAIAFRCHRWGCPHCGPRRVGPFVARLTHILNGWDRVRLLTLTLNPALVPHDIRPDRYLKNRFKLLRRYLARTCPRYNCFQDAQRGVCSTHGEVPKRPPLQYAWLLEYTKKGTPHLHASVDQYIPRAWLKATWERVSGAWNVDIRALDPADTAEYLAKYMTKSMGILAEDVAHPLARRVPKGSHLFGSSKGLGITPPRVASGEWELIKEPDDVMALAVPGGGA
jgi:hypothetical protein